MKQKSHITIIGIGLGLQDMSNRMLRIVASAQVLVGGRRQLALFPGHSGEKILIGRDATSHVKKLKAMLRGKSVAVLASGDPNFYGIAALFYENFTKKNISVIPNCTAFQTAFARIREAWNDALFISVHGKTIKALDGIVRTSGTFVVYCDGINTPAAVSAYLIEHDRMLELCKVWVFDSLGTPMEKIFSGSLKQAQRLKNTNLSMMIIRNEQPYIIPSLGIADIAFEHQHGMITKRDVRLAALARLEFTGGLVLWDIGAGSGSVSIEAANLYPAIAVYAVEKDPGRFNDLQKNIKKFRVPNVMAIHGCAPAVFAELPLPDRIFIGGSGGELAAILKQAKLRLKPNGCIVVNCVILESLDTVIACFKKWKWRYDVTSMQLAHLSSGNKPEMFRAENPVFIIQGQPERKVR
jgi:precorrin-6B C5,15-methyltransferase / cobalt-precorrin-6B C5,C15-methyltransferase